MLLRQDINMTASSFMSTSNNSNSGQMANMEDDKSIVLHNPIYHDTHKQSKSTATAVWTTNTIKWS
jgi:hypothetical protein